MRVWCDLLMGGLLAELLAEGRKEAFLGLSMGWVAGYMVEGGYWGNRVIILEERTGGGGVL